MHKKTAYTFIDFIATIIVLIVLIALLMPWFGRQMRRSSRVVCGTNLKGLGTAMVVYGNDYDDEYPVLGKGTWSKKLGYSYEDSKFNPYDYKGKCTISSSLYMLVREADVSPKSFVCPKSEQAEFNGENSKNLDIVELWDFGKNPYPHVSYVYHQPYSEYAADGLRSSAFAIMADMNPWMKEGAFVSAPDQYGFPQIITADDRQTYKFGNNLDHAEETQNWSGQYKKIKGTTQGQNVLYADGHTEFQKQPNVGINNDNIYTYWSTDEDPTDQDKQGGTAPTSRSAENDAKSVEDSFLVL